jgi:hypothetical protein
VLVLWWVLWGPTAYFTIFLFYTRRDKFPIKQRWPQMVISTMLLHVTSMLMLSLVDVVFARGLPAVLDPLCLLFGTTSCAFLVLIRVWKFYFDFRSSQDRVQQNLNSWFLRNRALGEQFNLICSGGGILVVYIIISFVITSVNGTWRKTYFQVGYPPSAVVDDTNSIFLVSTLLNGIFMVIFAFLLKDKEDGLRIKSEFRITGLLIVGIMILFGAMLLGNVYGDIASMLFANITCLAMVLIQIWYPLILSYRFERRGKTSDLNLSSISHNNGSQDGQKSPRAKKPVQLKLDNVLADSQMLEDLKVFLTQELSVENLLFILELQKFKQSSVGGDLERLSEQLIKKYILNQAPFQLNLSGKTQRSLSNKFEEIQMKNATGGSSVIVDNTLFKDAESEIRALLETDPLIRFRRSQLNKAKMSTIDEPKGTTSGFPPTEAFQV